MMNLLLTTFASFIITVLVVPAVIRVADEKGLFYLPDSRKLHMRPTSFLGGVGIFIGFYIVAQFRISIHENPEFQYFFVASLLIFFLGIKDDILILSASKKLLGQLAAAAIVIHLADIRIDSMHGFLNVYELPDYISYPISYITIVVIINAFNLIDGVDGLAGSLGILTTAVFGTYFVMAGLPAYAMFAFALTGALVAFLVYNYHPAKIFMGDSGSLLLGLVNSILVIKFITVADSSAGSFPITSSVAIGFSILMIPLLDTLRVFSVRIAKGRSPFSPDRNHIHHLLLDQGLNHRQVTHLCLVINVCFIALAYIGRSVGSTILLCSLIGASYILIGILKWRKRRPVLIVAGSTFHEVQPSSEKKVASFEAQSSIKDDVVIYIADETVPLAVQEKITNSAGDLMELFGYELDFKEEPIFGSFWQKIDFTRKRNTTQEQIDAAVKKALAAAETQTLGIPEAKRTNEISQAVKNLVDSMRSVENGLAKVGSLLVMKKVINGNPQIFTWELPIHIKQTFDEKPKLLTDVDLVYQLMTGDIPKAKKIDDSDDAVIGQAV